MFVLFSVHREIDYAVQDPLVVNRGSISQLASFEDVWPVVLKPKAINALCDLLLGKLSGILYEIATLALSLNDIFCLPQQRLHLLEVLHHNLLNF